MSRKNGCVYGSIMFAIDKKHSGIVDEAPSTHEEVSSKASNVSDSSLEDSEAELASSHHRKDGKLGVIPLAILVFYSVSGGPFGVEAAVRSGGYFYTLLGFLILPWFWSLAEAAMTAELGTAFPEAAGGVAWVETAFGPAAGWMAGYLGWMAGATDNAIYPVLFLEYLLQVLGDEQDAVNLHPYWRFALLSTTSIFLAYINWLGLPVVGQMSLIICVIAMSPFIILCVVGAFSVEPHRWWLRPTNEPDVIGDDSTAVGGIAWRVFLNNLFWNLNSFDAAASFAGDVQDPVERVLPRAMGWSVLLVAAGYFLPLLVATGALDDAVFTYRDWTDGFFAKVASEVVGPWLGAWTVFAAGVSNIALFQAELSADAFQLAGMAERGHVPSCFATRSRHNTPTYGIMLGTLVIVILSVAKLDTLIEMLNFNYALALLLEYAAFVSLRLNFPDLNRPFRVPLNNTICLVFLCPTVCLIFVVLSLANRETYLFSFVANLVGIVIYVLRKNQYCTTKTGHSNGRNAAQYSAIQGETELTETHDHLNGQGFKLSDAMNDSTTL